MWVVNASVTKEQTSLDVQIFCLQPRCGQFLKNGDVHEGKETVKNCEVKKRKTNHK